MSVSLTIGQGQYNGVNIGPGSNVFTQWNTIKGLTGLPDIRKGNVPRPNDEGMLAGYDFYGERTIEFNLEVTAGGGNTMQQNLNAVRQGLLKATSLGGGVNSLSPPPTRLYFNLGEQLSAGTVGVTRFVNARVEKFEDTVDLGWAAGSWQGGLARIAVQMGAVDPRIYDANAQSASVGLTVAAGGWTFPWTFPWAFTSNTGSLITAVNNGIYACPPYFTITGPCVNPRVQNQTTGVTLQFNTTLNAGDTLTVDSFSGSAVLNGTASRLSTLAPGSYISTFLIQPGSNTVAFYSSDGTVTGAQLTLYWANTWI